jgi:hypothetical protein
MWDKEDRELDSRRLERGEGVLSLGHETVATSVQDAEWDEILSMPPHSVWPFLFGLCMPGVFAMLLLSHYWVALGFLAAGGLVGLGWHHREVEA